MKRDQALHTPPITLGECGRQDHGAAPEGGAPAIAGRAIGAKLTQGSGRGTCRWKKRGTSGGRDARHGLTGGLPADK